MSYQRRILMSQQNSDTNMSEVYTYAAQFNITPQQVNAALADKPTQIREKLIAWKYLLHSLLDTGYTPWLKGDGVAYINTGVVPTNTDIISTKLKVDEVSENCVFWGIRQSGSWNSYNYNQIYESKNKTTYVWSYGATTNVATKQVNIGDILTTRVSLAEYVPSNIQFTHPYFLFAMNNKGSIANRSQNSISVWQVNDKKFVPYLDNGVYGMLDLTTGTFYGSSAPNGLFIYTLEDSDGNQVNIN